MGRQHFHRFRRKSFYRPSVSFRISCYEHLGQRHDLVRPFAQRRKVEVDRVDPVVKVLPELTFLHHLLQILVSGTDEPYVYRDGLRVADPCYAAVLDDPEQLGLKVEGNVADLVKEEGAAVRLLEFADVVGVGIGECALHMTEEFALEQSLGQGTCIHADHLSEGTFRPAVYLSRQHILSRTVFAGNQDICEGRGELVHVLSDQRHARTVAPVHFER